MSDNRKVLLAKRKDERTKCHNSTQNFRNQQFCSLKRGTKRSGCPNATPQKNLANDRLKRLRTSLNEEVQNPTPANKTKPEKSSRISNRKRQSDFVSQEVIAKLPKSYERVDNLNKNAFVFKEDYVHQQNFSFSANTSIFNQNTTEDSLKTVEDMEWCPADNMSITTTNNLATHPSNVNNFRVSQDEFLIVVDSNIFISHLQTIKNILSMNVTGSVKPVVFIPWIVLEELDFIKEDGRNGNLKFKAQEAIKFVENKLSSKHERIRGQTLDEVNEQKSVGKNQDNKIIASCLQILEKNSNMILLTGDINLKNKAHFNNIPVCSNSEIMMKISRLNQTKYQMIMNKMTTLCSTVIDECAKNAYGSASIKMPICQIPKNSLQDCILIFKKYWFAVFQEVLMKQFKKSIDDLSTFINTNACNTDDSRNQINELVRLCVRVCLFLKDVDCCKTTIERTICDLNNIKES